MKTIVKCSTIAALCLAVVTGSISCYAQAVDEPVIWTVDFENVVQYRGDVTDPTKLARDPNITTPQPTRAFQISYNAGDLVAVNGKPIKGFFTAIWGVVTSTVVPQSGLNVADLSSSSPLLGHNQFLGPDGAWIGSLTIFGGTSAAPGSIGTVIAGSGAWAGITGENRLLELITPPRVASVTEDPAARRINGGGKYRFMFTLYPKFRPTIQVTASGPAITHADYSPLTTANPARPGELLILAATGLGPVKPNLEPAGTIQFSGPPFQEVNSPVTVVFNGKEVPVTTKIGWPGQKSVYWIDFQVPSDAVAGTATLQLVAAWIPGPTVTIPVGAR